MFAEAELTTQAGVSRTAFAPNMKYTHLMLDILHGKTVPLDQTQIPWPGKKKELAGNPFKAALSAFCLFHRQPQHCTRAQS